ncbi:hypothetical protein [Pseudomonas putida]|jgi:hypothetical protein|uniref:hypothetical protein n=1 Tax=Pseudomonas putida TaxID=303 RepID=UPI001CD3DF9A|nr:hypothetical protein [Pseudomonas putida]
MDSMTTALNDVDVHAQTDGHPPSGEPVQVSELSSQRAAKKLAISLMPFLSQTAANTYEMDLSQA